MDKQKVKLGSIVLAVSIVTMILLVLILFRIAGLEIVILNIIGPLFLMAFFVGLFLLFSGLFHKDETTKQK